MSVHLGFNSYGKSKVRLTKLRRFPDRHELKEISVDITLSGDFSDTYLTGDNTNVIATDSMKNTVYVLGKEHSIGSIEDFAGTLVWHFVKTYKQVTHSSVSIAERRWERSMRAGTPHPHTFIAGSNELRTCVVGNSAGELVYHAGIEDLVLLKITDSEFTGYVRDKFTTLPETRDRIMASSVKASWTYRDVLKPNDWNEMFAQVRQALIETFAAHHSLSVQQTLYAMGEAALAKCSALHDIRITMPNQHRIPFNVEPFGLKNENDIFVPTDEPHGLIFGHLTRGDD